MLEKIEKKNLLSEIGLALNDTFVAELKEEENGIVLRFLNGQSFRLTLEEVTAP